MSAFKCSFQNGFGQERVVGNHYPRELTIGAIIGAGVACGAMQLSDVDAAARSVRAYRAVQTFGMAFDVASAKYVEAPDPHKMILAAVRGMLASLNPHSSYIDPKTFRNMKARARSAFGGVGLQLAQNVGLTEVVGVMADTPASRAGISPGDMVVEIDGASVSGLSLDEVESKLRGHAGARVKLVLFRGPSRKNLEFTLTRARIKPKSVLFHKVDDEIGYIRLTQFTARTGGEVKDAIQQLSREIGPGKFKGYVLDLRNISGGSLEDSANVANAFLAHGEIVSARGRAGDAIQRYSARLSGYLSQGRPTVVLINGGTVGGAEVVAGALQDHKKATVVGIRSFGYGTHQTIIQLGNGEGALRLTTSRYFTPSGKAIEGRGVEPDMVVREKAPADMSRKETGRCKAVLAAHPKTEGEAETCSSGYVPLDAAKDHQLAAAVQFLEKGAK